jgi:hypothetical protein
MEDDGVSGAKHVTTFNVGGKHRSMTPVRLFFPEDVSTASG